MNSIKAENLRISYDKKIIVDNLNLEIPKEKITIIIGSNGCGKSTILKTLGRIIKPKSGIVYLEEKDIKYLDSREIAKKLAILPQTPQAPEGLTVGQLISYGRYPHSKGFKGLTKDDKKIISWALKATKLSELEMTNIDNLSGGQRQRVWIAMALAQQSKTILLDEPTTYLDMSYQLEILKLLENLNRKNKTTIVMVLHDLNLAARFADYMVALKQGKIIEHGNPEKIMTKKVLKEVFNIDASIQIEKKTGKPICVSYDLV